MHEETALIMGLSKVKLASMVTPKSLADGTGYSSLQSNTISVIVPWVTTYSLILMQNFINNL